MSTRFHFTDKAVVNSFAPAFSAGWNVTTNAVRRSLWKSAKSTFTTVSVSDTTSSSPENVLAWQGISDPLATQTISGTVQGVVRARELNAAADARLQLRIYVVDYLGTTVRGVLFELDNASALASELDAATAVNRKMPFTGIGTLTPVNTVQGDRLVVELGVRYENTTATAYTVNFELGDSSATELPYDEVSTATNTPWIEFSQSLSIADGEPAGSNFGPAIDGIPQIANSDPALNYSASFPYSYVGGGSSAIDNTLPTVTNITPASGSVIGVNDAVSFRAIDDVTLRRYYVLVKYPALNNRYDVVWNGAQWDSTLYGSSTDTPVGVDGGVDAVVRRTGGWPAPFTLEIHAIDTGGNVRTQSVNYTLNVPYIPTISSITVT